MILIFGFLTEGSLDYIAALGVLSVVVVALLATKFVTKEDYARHRQYRDEVVKKQDERMQKADDRLVILEKNQALTEQPVRTMNETLGRIELSLNRYVDLAERRHSEMSERVARVELQQAAQHHP